MHPLTCFNFQSNGTVVLFKVVVNFCALPKIIPLKSSYQEVCGHLLYYLFMTKMTGVPGMFNTFTSENH